MKLEKLGPVGPEVLERGSKAPAIPGALPSLRTPNLHFEVAKEQKEK
jgi:hypothetical protein